jgi:glycosyltransferase involved in cell wall biosynthesis
MKILYIHFSIAVYGGIERVLSDKMNYLANSSDYDIFLVTCDQGTHPFSYILNNRIKHVDLGIRLHQQYKYPFPIRLWKHFSLLSLYNKKLKQTIDEISPDIIIGTEWIPPKLILRNKGDIPFILESHFGYSTINDRIQSNIIKRVIKYIEYKSFSKADVVVSLTQGDAELWRVRHARYVTVIPNPVHLGDKNSKSALKRKRVIFIGRFSEEKDIPTLFKIWENVHRRFPDWCLDLYGEGELKSELVGIISNTDLNIGLHPPTKDIFKELCNSSILVMTSKNESFGLVLVEAMSCGLPVIAFDCPFGPKDIICDGVNGFLIANRDMESFSSKMCQLMDNTDIRMRMGDNAFESVQNYNINVIMEKWKDLFDQLHHNRIK